MPRYRIISTEIVQTTIEIVAKDEDEALDKWELGDGEFIDTDVFQPEIESIVELDG